MPELSTTGGPEKGSNKGSLRKGLLAIGRTFWIVLSPITKRLAAAEGLINGWKFRRDVIRQMSLTVTNLHPKVIIGGTDRGGSYAEIYLNFGDFRLRITRAIYDPGREDLWANVGSISDPGAFFPMDYVIAALRRLDKTCEFPQFSQFPNSLASLDATVWAASSKLAQHLSATNYAEAKRMIQTVMHEEAALAHVE